MTEGSLAVTVDVEDWYHVPAVTGSSFSTFSDTDEFFDSWDGEYDYLTRPTLRTLDLLDRVGTTATFFVVADVVDNYPGLVEAIVGRGHEIGCHGLHHACAISPDTKAPRFTPNEYEERLTTAKRKLERVSGTSVVGFRAPGAYVAGWMLDVLDDVGFDYDSSVSRNSLYNKTDQSLNHITTTPYIPKRGSLTPGGNREFLELPWPYYETKLGRIPTGGGPLLRLLGRRIVQTGIEQSLEAGDTIFYFHPIDISRRRFPRMGNSKRRPAYWLFKGKRTEKRISELLRSVSTPTSTCREIADDYLTTPLLQ